jgi:hypothetical protein
MRSDDFGIVWGSPHGAFVIFLLLELMVLIVLAYRSCQSPSVCRFPDHCDAADLGHTDDNQP